MKVVVHVLGPPTPAGAWENIAVFEDAQVPEVGDLVIVTYGSPVLGRVGLVQWGDDRVDVAVQADTLSLAMVGADDDWRVALAPDTCGEHLAEEVEQFLEDEAEGGWAP